MRVETFTQFACQFGKSYVDASDVDGHVCSPLLKERGRGRGQGRGLKERRHERDLVILAAIVQLCPILPAIPKGAYDFDLLAQFTGHRVGPGHAKSPLDVRFDLRAKSQDESSARLGGEVPGGVCQIGRRTRKGNRDSRPEFETRRMFGDQSTREERVVLSLLSPQRVESNFLRGLRDRGNIFQSNRGKCGIEFHSTFPSLRGREPEAISYFDVR